MSKPQKPCNNKTKSCNDNEKLKKFFENIKNAPMDYTHEHEVEHRNLLDSMEEDDYTPSNVEFVVGDSIEDTELYVEGVQITGCIKASLDYNTELGVPTLTLTVIKPSIVSPACRNCGL